ncbi:hypothetical protein [Solemya velesiana gill symbiont]|uniref:hypothetical protein n=1 Tax=Solemya velesiana gill symbiont TaxID=1918948 RepID=UPI0015615B1B|nr:hypothetical protein [Solemya velesiana gill symbiont]
MNKMGLGIGRGLLLVGLVLLGGVTQAQSEEGATSEAPKSIGGPLTKDGLKT